MTERGLDGAAELAAGRRALLAEFLGTAFLLAGIVGSGIMAQRLTDDAGLRLLINAVATASVLAALILALGPASGGHFNPAVTVADRMFGGMGTALAAAYVAVQIAGGLVGVIVANLMFEQPAVALSETARHGAGTALAEAIATLGLLVVIFGVVRAGRPLVAAFSVGGYIAGAFFFTSSTSFANPAVTLGRTVSNTFAGIAPASVPVFLLAQVVAIAVAVPVIRAIYPGVEELAGDVVVPHGNRPDAHASDGRKSL